MSIEPGKVGPPARDWHPLKKLQAANHYHFSCSIDELSMMPDQLRGQLFLGKKNKKRISASPCHACGDISSSRDDRGGFGFSVRAVFDCSGDKKLELSVKYSFRVQRMWE